jgi:hypothetical protein
MYSRHPTRSSSLFSVQPVTPIFSPMDLAGPNRHVPLVQRVQAAREQAPRQASNLGSILAATAKHAITLAGLPEPTNSQEMIAGIVQVAQKVKSLYDNAQHERERTAALLKAQSVQTSQARQVVPDDVVDAD